MDSRLIKLAPINRQTLALVPPSNPTGFIGLNWQKKAGSYLRHPRRFELSIWYGDKLQGVSFGRASKGNQRVRIDMVERTDSALRGFIYPITLECALAYAINIDRRTVVIKDPVPALVSYYMDEYAGYVTHHPRGKTKLRREHISFDVYRLLDDIHIATTATTSGSNDQN